MNKASRNFILGSLSVLSLVLIVAWMAGLFSNKVAPVLRVLESQAYSDAITIQGESQLTMESVPAAVAAKQATNISSRLLARITNVSVRSGDSVKQGQLLIELEKSDLLARSNQSQEQINSITARLTEAKANLSRAEKLIKDGSIAAFEFDKIRASHDALVADLASAKLALQEAQTAVSYSEIRSPIDGRVTDRYAEPGNTATPGAILLSIYNPVSVRIEAHVREQLAIALQLGQKVNVEIPSLQKKLPAEIEEITPAANSNSRSFLVKARIQYEAELLPGMYARLLLPAKERQHISIPDSHLLTVGQLNIVWVLSGDSLQRRYVKVGKKLEGQRIEIISGLDEGETIALTQ